MYTKIGFAKSKATLTSSLFTITYYFCKRQMIHTFTPSNQRVKVVAGGEVYETYTRRMERTDR